MNKAKELYDDIRQQVINERLQELEQRHQTQEKLLLKKTVEEVSLNLELIDSMLANDKVLLAQAQKRTHRQLRGIILKADVQQFLVDNHRPILAWVQGSGKEPYIIKAHERYGMSCNCPSWKFNHHGDRTCKHTVKVREHIEVV